MGKHPGKSSPTFHVFFNIIQILNAGFNNVSASACSFWQYPTATDRQKVERKPSHYQIEGIRRLSQCNLRPAALMTVGDVDWAEDPQIRVGLIFINSPDGLQIPAFKGGWLHHLGGCFRHRNRCPPGRKLLGRSSS